MAGFADLEDSLEQNEANQMAADIDEVTGFVNTLSSTFETLASGEKVNAEQLLEFYRSFGAELSAEELQARMNLSPRELIDQIWADMNAVADTLEGQDKALVQEAQKKMQELQATLKGLVVDGIFGDKTKAKVKEFQKSKNLLSDGIVGKNTAHALGWTYKGKQ